MFVNGRPFQPGLIFVGKVRNLPKGEVSEMNFTLVRLQPYLLGLGLCSKGLPGTNTLAYYEHS